MQYFARPAIRTVRMSEKGMQNDPAPDKKGDKIPNKNKAHYNKKSKQAKDSASPGQHIAATFWYRTTKNETELRCLRGLAAKNSKQIAVKVPVSYHAATSFS